jgi:hypothetical protein
VEEEVGGDTGRYADPGRGPRGRRRRGRREEVLTTILITILITILDFHNQGGHGALFLIDQRELMLLSCILAVFNYYA